MNKTRRQIAATVASDMAGIVREWWHGRRRGPVEEYPTEPLPRLED